MALPDALFAERLMTHRFAIAQRLAARTTPSNRREVAGGPLAAALTAAVVEAGADRLFDLADSELPAPAPGAATLIASARLHGTLRARDDGTLDALLAEYRSLRLGVADALMLGDVAGVPVPDRGGSVPPRLHATIDRALAAAADAFGLERRRQRETLREAQDHAMRGALNAIRLATLVHRQTGADTSEVTERHGLRLQALLDRHLVPDTDHRALRPDDLPPRDLTHAAREAVARWNAAGSDRQARCHAYAPCMGRFDIGRVHEALAALFDAAEARAGRQAPVTLTLERGPAAARLVVQVARTGNAAPDAPPSAAADEPLIRLLLQQTAASHRGRLETVAEPDGAVAYRLTLAVDPQPEAPEPTARGD